MNDESKKMLRDLSFCVFDLETTGGNQKSDQIIEIGLVKVKNLEIVDTKNYLIKPNVKIPDFIQKLTAISPKDLENSPSIEEVIDEILDFMDDSVLVAHNTSFDIPFFNSVLKRLGKSPMKNKSLCTNLMTKYMIPNLLNTNLNYMSKIFGIEHKKAHRALDDASATAQLLLTFLKIFIDKDIQKINHLYYPRNRYELDRINIKEEEGLSQVLTIAKNLQTPFLVTVKGENGVILFSLPCLGKEQEFTFIKEKVQSLPWLTTTIRMFGPFLEALVNFSSIFSKIDFKEKEEILSFLEILHLPSSDSKKVDHNQTSMINKITLDKDKNFDFVIMNHLVPEQYIVFPLASLQQRSQLIFRYPGHKKKLIQYINSKVSRLNANRERIHPIPTTLKNFIQTYVNYIQTVENELFVFNKKIPLKNPEEFFKKFDEFSGKNPNSYNYPKNYIKSNN